MNDQTKPVIKKAEVNRHRKTERSRFIGKLLILAGAGDFLLFSLALFLGFWLRFESGLCGSETDVHSSFSSYMSLFISGWSAFIILMLFSHAYHVKNIRRFRYAFKVICKSLIYWMLIFLSIALVFKINPPISRLFVFFSGIFALVLLGFWRYAFARSLSKIPGRELLQDRILVVGWNEHAYRLEEAIYPMQHAFYNIVGCVPSTKGELDMQPPTHISVLGELSNLEQLINEYEVDIVVAADLDPSTEDMANIINVCEQEMVDFKFVPTFFRILLSGLHMDSIHGVPLFGFGALPLESMVNRIIKRVIDLVGGLVGLILFAPVIALFGLIVYKESPGPIFYKQVRMGKRGRNFNIIKIRSMRLNAETKGAQWAQENDPRRLKVGALMRKLNIDELPQFWNVLKGEMSLVGPRPERPELIQGFKTKIPHYNARHYVKPGVTGWAQVNGLRGNTDLTKRIVYDIYYMENWNVWFDFVIMARTVKANKNAY